MNVTNVNTYLFMNSSKNYAISATSILLSSILFSECYTDKNISIEIEKNKKNIEMKDNFEPKVRELIDDRYIVVGGDTLDDIAYSFGITEHDLMVANNLLDNNIYPEQVLLIPTQEELRKIYALDIPSEPIIEEKPELVEKVIDPHEGKKLVALTFDGGSNNNSMRLVSLLDRYNAKGTFFINGKDIEGNEEIIREVAYNGNQIGVQGYTHKSFTKMPMADILDELYATNEMLFSIGVAPSKAVRPPYGNLNETIKLNVPNPFILWNIDTRDWESQNKDVIKNNIKNNIKDGSIILMHDEYTATIDALEEVLPELIDQDYEFVTVEEMYKYNHIELEKGKVYTMIKKDNKKTSSN